MADGTRTLRVRLSLRTSFAIAFALGAAVLLLEILHNAERVIAWVAAAAAVAALLYPAVEWLAHFRFIPRALAVIITALIMLGTIGFLGYRVVNDVTNATSTLQEAAPERAAQLEQSSDFFKEIKLRQRVENLVNGIPSRLRGGETSQALKSAVTRTVAFIAGIILTIFFILYGQRLIEGGLGQIDDEATRRRASDVFRIGSRRGLFFARVKLWESGVEGLLAYSIARMAGVPGPAALGVWVALWSLLPVAGVLIGALPIVVFAGAQSTERAVIVALAFVVIGFADYLVNRWLERRSIHMGSFLIVFAAFSGLEFYGLMGALLFVLGSVVLAAILSEYGLERVAERLTTEQPAISSSRESP
jgi:predicted PurR-regulated permease PerM